MRLSDDTHDYECSHCQQRGGVCMEALWLSQRVARGLAERADILPEGFGLTSETQFSGCGRTCRVRLLVDGLRVEVISGLADGRDTASARVTAEYRTPLQALVASA